MPGPLEIGRVGSQEPRATNALRVGLVLLGVVGLAVILYRLQELLVVVVIAIVLAEGLRPLVDGIEKRGLPREAARAVIYLGIVLALVGAVGLLARPVVGQLRQVVADLPLYQVKLESNVAPLLKQLSLDSNVGSQLGASATGVARVALALGAGLARGVLDLLGVLLLSFLWLSASRPFGGFLLGLLPAAGRSDALETWVEISRGFAGYVRGVAINMVVIGVVTGTAAALLGLPAPVLLGVLAGLTEVIPIVGPIIGAIPAILLGFTISPYHPILVALVYLAIQQAEAHTLVPLVMRRAVGLPALAVVVALAAGAALAGIGGALVAVPLAFALQVVILRLIAPAVRAANDAVAS